MTDRIGWAAALFVLGAIVGSFVGALSVRWPRGVSVVAGRSRCDRCGAAIRVRDLVPLVSLLWLRGRCRDCGGAIDVRHAVAEWLCAAIGAAAGAAVAGPAALAGCALGWLLAALALLDLSHLWLPDRLVAALSLGGVGAAAAGLPPAPGDRVIGAIGGFAALWLVGAGYRRWRGREGLGGGDPKLFGAIGMWLGWRLLPAVLLIAALVGLGVAAFAWARGRPLARDAALPFGTLLAVAAYPAWLAMVTAMP